MLVQCGSMAVVAKCVAGIGAMLYVGYRVWQSLARAEPIDVFPLLRPFVLGLCIMFFPTLVLGSIDGILRPVNRATASLMEYETFNVHRFQQEKRPASARGDAPQSGNGLSGQRRRVRPSASMSWDEVPATAVMAGMYAERTAYNIGEAVRGWFRSLLELFFQAAGLAVDTLRTFFLIVLALLGPPRLSPSPYMTDSSPR